jgi:hypothetical protein
MKKVCSGCGQERDIESDFRWHNKDRGIRQRWCKYCLAEANKIHYQNNKQIYIERALSRNARVDAENKSKLYAYLSEHPCVDCGNNDIRCLEFDHVRGKKSANISQMLGHAVTWSVIEAEIVKCEVRCANCHRIKTLERDKLWRFRQAE